MIFNIHIFAIGITFIFYIILKEFKKDTLELNKNNKKKQSNLIYVLFAPFAVYLTYYIFLNKNEKTSEPVNITKQLETEILPSETINKISYKNPSIYPMESTLSDIS